MIATRDTIQDNENRWEKHKLSVFIPGLENNNKNRTSQLGIGGGSNLHQVKNQLK